MKWTHKLKSALERGAAKGWVQQISGKGFSGSYRLSWPYYPAPKELWGKDYTEPGQKDEDEVEVKKKESPEKKSAKKTSAVKERESKRGGGKKRTYAEVDSDEDEEDEEEAPKPKKTYAEVD